MKSVLLLFYCTTVLLYFCTTVLTHSCVYALVSIRFWFLRVNCIPNCAVIFEFRVNMYPCISRILNLQYPCTFVLNFIYF